MDLRSWRGPCFFAGVQKFEVTNVDFTATICYNKIANANRNKIFESIAHVAVTERLTDELKGTDA